MSPFLRKILYFLNNQLYPYLLENRVLGVIALLLATVFVYISILAAYRLYFHPLAKFPGPKLAAISDIWFGYVSVTGRSVWIIKDIHERYGPIVRVAPNDLSFATASSYKDIYGRNPARKTFIKTEFYEAISEGFEHSGVGTERDPVIHQQKRKLFAPVFSMPALRDFEFVILDHLDKFLKGVERRGAEKEGVDIMEWFHFLTFDTTGDLAFGEDFGALEKGTAHEWMSLILDNLDIAAYSEAARRFPIVNFMIHKFVPQRLLDARTWHVEWSKQKTYKQVNPMLYDAQPDRRDLLTYILEQKKEAGMSHDEVTANASQIILAGSETVATFCTGTLYYLLKTPRVVELLKKEIREAFASVDDMTANNLVDMRYLAAVIKGLRIFPPGPTGAPRSSPGEFVDGQWIPKDVKVTTHPITLTRSASNFKNPDEFIPERWTDPENTDTKEASQPFLLGPQQCIAQNMAWIEMRLYLSKLFWLYDIELVDPNEDWEAKCKAYMLWSKAPLKVLLARRADLVTT